MTSARAFSAQDIKNAGQRAEDSLEKAGADGVLDPHHERNQMLSHLRVGVVDRIIEKNLTTATEIAAFLRDELARLQSAPASSTAREIRILITGFATALGIQHELTTNAPGKSTDISPHGH